MRNELFTDIFSIHNLYDNLISKKINLSNYLKQKYRDINDRYFCCSKYHTLLSYIFETDNIDYGLLTEVLGHKPDLFFVFPDGTSPFYYLLNYQDIICIEYVLSFLHITKHQININTVRNLFIISTKLIERERKDIFIYILHNNFDILLSQHTLNIIHENKKLNWIYSAADEIYYTLLLLSKSKQKNPFNKLSFDVIGKIYQLSFT
jgi:hypothetical protein